MNRAAGNLLTQVEGGEDLVDRALAPQDRHDLAEVPWFVWALDHAREAEHAEAWLRASDPQQATQRRSPITPWMLWAIDHPCEAERAEAWLDEVAAGEAPTPSSIDDQGSNAARGTQDGASKREGSPLWRRATSATVTATLALALILVIFLGYGRLDNRWYHLVTVQGGSMEPTYSIGDVLVLTRPPEQIEVGMVLTMQVEGSVVTHRVVEVGDDGSFVTQGDANDFPDDFSGLDVRVVGEVRGSLPLIGRYLGGRSSTNAWFTDRATASAALAAATTFAPEEPEDVAVLHAAAESVEEPENTLGETPPDDTTDRQVTAGIVGDTIPGDTVADDTIPDDSAAAGGSSNDGAEPVQEG